MTLRLGTRGSVLARAQADLVAADLRRIGIATRIVVIEESGDLDERPLPGRAVEGIFVTGLRAALEGGRVDLLVHSAKDVPIGGAAPAAVLRRADPRDAVVGDVDARPARVGTCSVRRAAWAARTWPEAAVVPVRGPIDRRMERVREGSLSAVILAMAGLLRLGGPTPPITPIPVEDLVPAPAQGALLIEAGPRASAVARLDHRPSRLAIAAERAVLAAIDPTDATAVGALAQVRGGIARLLADLAEPDGSDRFVARAVAPVRTQREAADAGERMAEHLLRRRDRARWAS